MRRSIIVIALVLASCENFDGTFPTAEGKIRNAVRDDLMDPDSAKFKELSQCAGDAEVWSGQVNSKNAFGAYVGFKSFLAKRTTAVFWSHPMYDDLMLQCHKGDPRLEELRRILPPDEVRIQQ